MTRRRDPFELPESGFPIATVIEEMSEINPCFMKVGIQPQGSAEVPAGFQLIPETVKAVCQRSGGFSVVRTNGNGLGEHITGLGKEPLSIQGSAHGEHEIHILIEAHVLDFSEVCQRLSVVTHSEQNLTHTDQCVFVDGIQHQSLVKGPSGPGKFFSGQTGVAQPYVELHRIRIERKALPKHLEGPVKIAVAVKPVGLLVVFLGAEEPIFLHKRLLGENPRCGLVSGAECAPGPTALNSG
jgi:hypothetical protein